MVPECSRPRRTSPKYQRRLCRRRRRRRSRRSRSCELRSACGRTYRSRTESERRKKDKRQRWQQAAAAGGGGSEGQSAWAARGARQVREQAIAWEGNEVLGIHIGGAPDAAV